MDTALLEEVEKHECDGVVDRRVVLLVCVTYDQFDLDIQRCIGTSSLKTNDARQETTQKKITTRMHNLQEEKDLFLSQLQKRNSAGGTSKK